MAFKHDLNFLFIINIVAVTILLISSSSSSSDIDPKPRPWPHQFHSVLFMNYSGIIEIIDLWYDWPNGRNFNIIHQQLGNTLYDLEWNNGTSFFYTLDSTKQCRSSQLEVGILRPNWLDGANYLGQRQVNGFLCNVWEKVDFIWYYEDADTKRPVLWVFYTGMYMHVLLTLGVCFHGYWLCLTAQGQGLGLTILAIAGREAHVMTFEVGAALEDHKWQAPVYCFQNQTQQPPILLNQRLWGGASPL